MSQLELTQTYVTYQAQTKLLELGIQIADARLRISKPEINEAFNQAIKIRLWLKALQYSDYLEKEEIDKLVLCLAQLCDANAIPYAPVITTVSAPSILVGIPGATGSEGEEGPEGGGVPFSVSNIVIDTIVDSFDISVARAAEWTVNIYGASGQRVQKIIGGWSADGLSYGDDGGDGTDNIYGDTSPVTISVVVTGTTAKLFAAVTSGTWTIEGTRKYIPNNGNGIVTPTTLADGKIWVGNASNNPIAVTCSGDITITNAGVAAISSGVIVNADINASAAIALTKLAASTASRAIVTDGSGFLTTSTTTATQIGYLSTVTSDVQVQLDSKLSGGTGAISTVVSSNLTASRAVISNALGKIAVSNTTDTELGYVNGVTSAIQTQLNSRVLDTGDTMTGALINTSTIEAQGGIRTASSGAYIKTKSVEIGAWNMDTTSSITVTGLGLPSTASILDISVMILNDGGGGFPLTGWSSSTSGSQGGVGNYTFAAVDLYRLNSGLFDSGSYSSTLINRGKVTITYEA